MRWRALCVLLTLVGIAGFAAVEKVKALREANGNAPTSPHSPRPFRAVRKMVPASIVPIQSNDVKDLAPGTLLVASRGIIDPNFAKSVVLLIHYDENEAEGLILNRRTAAPLSTLLKDFKAGNELSGRVYIGGPVQPRSMFSLLQLPTQQEGSERIFDKVYLVKSKTLFDETVSHRPAPSIFRVYLGCALWTPDQLDKEVALGAWFIFPPAADAVFTEDPDSLWLQMIQKTEMNIARSEAQQPLHF